MLQISALEKLVHELSRLPGIGPKTAQRLAYFILRSPMEYSEKLSAALMQVKTEVHPCPKCYNYTDLELCYFCDDPHRNNDSICVVEEPNNISRIEASGVFRGRYHVLHGSISPLEGIGPDQLKIPELLKRVEESFGDQQSPIKEIIFALDADLEGDTTVLYLSKQLAHKNIKLSRIAHGVPIGSDMDYIDDRTIGRALQNRVEL
jgi:recombination protein RecR